MPEISHPKLPTENVRVVGPFANLELQPVIAPPVTVTWTMPE
jgi:hypothetical protein